MNVPLAAPQLAQFSDMDVFVHRSAHGSIENGRLAFVGERALRQSYYIALTKVYPAGSERLVGGDHQRHFDKTFDAFIIHWVGIYGWRNIVRGVPHGVNLLEQGETKHIFYAFAGAVVRDYDRLSGIGAGQAVLDQWVLRLAQGR